MIQMGKDKSGNTASTHEHNDHGVQVRDGDFIVTYCACGSEVARDFSPRTK